MLTGFVVGDRGLGPSGDTHPAWMMAHAVAGPYFVVGASAIGQIHLARRAPRDDAFVIRAAGSWLSVAVADGVGSRPFSRYGATYVAEALSALLLRPLVPPLKLADAPQAAPQSLKRGNLAPPSRVQEVPLRVGVARLKRRMRLKLCLRPKRGVRLKPGVVSLVAGLRDWTLALDRIEARQSSDWPQAASIGWWPPGARTEPSAPEAGLLTGAMHLPVGSGGEPSGMSPKVPDDTRVDLVEIVKQAFIKTHLGLREHARSLDLELADLSCTALALLLNVETGEAAVGQVGDGAILGLTAQGKVLDLVQPPDTGDPQATYTLNKPSFEQHLARGLIARAPADPFVAFFVMTDGLSGDLLYSPRPDALEEWAQKVDHNLRASPSPAQAGAGMLNWLATYEVKGSWDDRTLVVITHRERDHGNRDVVTEQPESAEPVGDQ